MTDTMTIDSIGLTPFQSLRSSEFDTELPGDTPDFVTPTASGDAFEGRAEVYRLPGGGAVLALSDASLFLAYAVENYDDAVALAQDVYNSASFDVEIEDGSPVEVREALAMVKALTALPGVWIYSPENVHA
jgi:hypothetical protein